MLLFYMLFFKHEMLHEFKACQLGLCSISVDFILVFFSFFKNVTEQIKQVDDLTKNGQCFISINAPLHKSILKIPLPTSKMNK